MLKYPILILKKINMGSTNIIQNIILYYIQLYVQLLLKRIILYTV